MPVLDDHHPEWKGLLSDMGSLKTEQATIKADLKNQAERIESFDEKLDKINTTVFGDADSIGLRGDMIETKTVLKQIRFLVYMLLLITLAEYSPKLADLISSLMR